jgi:HAD superfamily hydrolase (TIGR01490 family)
VSLAPPTRQAAVFDFDRTVFHGDAGARFGMELERIGWRRAVDTNPGTVGWLGRILGFLMRFLWHLLQALVLIPLYLLRIVKRSTLVRISYRGLKGWPAEEVEQLARDYFDEVLAERIYPDALKAMRERQGHLVVIATTNMRVLVNNIMRHAPVDHVIGTDLETDDGLLTGRIHGPTWGQEKAEAVRAWAHASGVSLPKSHGYTDHYSDHHFLHLFGSPHVVNPDFRLKRMAKKRRWPIHRFRPAAEPSD